ncbi:tripartite tricarboxylate transporter TctB family protein [Amphritea sp. 1_MG-2023]|uniref:tripartite tricarboxylate transporter TctB family protein n=1 Tax=Amphritea sp. 1_MG-2023 TaxID=3062670 RepID=UPI0026E11F14|nr:tripartite tricarboxylate transporter TctB family protein [Amphritea sp. 1_MG-2023]MDO6565160.1 tripartite tricarboxylate transporter TctB family protein [Amphritea sp. 1_MG-2023]
MSDVLTVTTSDSVPRRDIGGMVCAAVFILLGAACLYETTLMTDPDSYLFPRMIITGLMGLSLVLIISELINPSKGNVAGESADQHYSQRRRILLVIAMMVAVLLMPFIGFLLSGFAVFAALMLLAQYDPWTTRKLGLYSLVAVAIVCGFFCVFSYLLNVPLPQGSLLQFP